MFLWWVVFLFQFHQAAEPFFLLAGPNVIESEEHIMRMAKHIKSIATKYVTNLYSALLYFSLMGKWGCSKGHLFRNCWCRQVELSNYLLLILLLMFGNQLKYNQHSVIFDNSFRHWYRSRTNDRFEANCFVCEIKYFFLPNIERFNKLFCTLSSFKKYIITTIWEVTV